VGPRESDTYFLSPDEVAQKAVEAWQLGATEVCIQGGLPHGLPPFYYRDILRAVKERSAGDAHPRFFTDGNCLWRRTHRHATRRLSFDASRQWPRYAAGTAAEILDDEIRDILSRNKLTTAQWIEVIRTAHRLGIRSTSTMMYGHTETPQHWVRQMRLLRDIQDETGGLHRICPARVRASEHAAVSPGPRSKRPHACGASEGARLVPLVARRVDQQHSGFLGEVEPPPLATLPACRS